MKASYLCIMKGLLSDIIIALSTPPGEGAIAVIRLSGKGCIDLVDKHFSGSSLSDKPGYTVHFGKIVNGDELIDEVLVTLFRNPKSYTKEDVVEISCHGSSYIIHRIIQVLIDAGARQAKKGEFTMRAFLNGQMDLSQAEAVADLIASDNKASHELALQQMRGGFSHKIQGLRQELIDFAALIELELDFGEEDVEFADRGKLEELIEKIQGVLHELIDSFRYGNAMKRGIPIAIVGKPNVGKSTLLNALLSEERAIVSDIPGTTRDVIEDQLTIEGFPFRVIDTAGIRETADKVEAIGIHKTHQQIEKAHIVLYLHDIREDYKDIAQAVKDLSIKDNQHLIILLNKADLIDTMCHAYDIEEAVSTSTGRRKTIAFSAATGEGIENIRKALVKLAEEGKVEDGTIVTNSRHYEALTKALKSLDDVLNGLRSGVTGDFIAMDIRQSLHYLGEITGTISSEDLLDSIFGRFCIGK